jgi:hypothetical protein
MNKIIKQDINKTLKSFLSLFKKICIVGIERCSINDGLNDYSGSISAILAKITPLPLLLI